VRNYVNWQNKTSSEGYMKMEDQWFLKKLLQTIQDEDVSIMYWMDTLSGLKTYLNFPSRRKNIFKLRKNN